MEKKQETEKREYEKMGKGITEKDVSIIRYHHRFQCPWQLRSA